MNANRTRRRTPSLIKPSFFLPGGIAPADALLVSAVWLILLARFVAIGG